MRRRKPIFFFLLCLDNIDDEKYSEDKRDDTENGIDHDQSRFSTGQGFIDYDIRADSVHRIRRKNLVQNILCRFHMPFNPFISISKKTISLRRSCSSLISHKRYQKISVNREFLFFGIAMDIRDQLFSGFGIVF